MGSQVKLEVPVVPGKPLLASQVFEPGQRSYPPPPSGELVSTAPSVPTDGRPTPRPGPPQLPRIDEPNPESH